MADDPLVHIIDDDDAVRESLRFLVECAGYRVATHASAVDFVGALAADAEPAPRCIVTDVRMPDMTGLELVEQLKARGASDPIVMITGHADVAMAIQAMKAGVFDFIEKPFTDDAILSAIARAIEKSSAEADAGRERREAEALIATLSQREREVLDGLVEGKANKMIAYDLGISVRTVEVYRAHLMTKMRARSLSELVRRALSAR